MNFTFNDQLASDASESKSQRITSSGVYFGTITSASYKKFTDGGEVFNLDFTDDSGKECNFMGMSLTKKDGTPSWMVGLLHSMFGCLKMREANSDANGKYPAIAGKKIGIGIQKTPNGGKVKDNGGKWDKFTPVRFFCYDTKQTYTEFKNKATANEYTNPIEDYVTSGSFSSAPNTSAPHPADSSDSSDLPF